MIPISSRCCGQCVSDLVAAVALAGPYVEGNAGGDEAEGEEQGGVGRRQGEHVEDCE